MKQHVPSAKKPTLSNIWIRECQSKPLALSRGDDIALVRGNVKKHREDIHFKTATWMELAMDIAVTHPQGADVWVGMWPPPHTTDNYLSHDSKTVTAPTPMLSQT